MRYFLFIFLLVCIATVSFLGFRGTTFTEPPICVFPDMDNQAKYKPQGRNDFFANGMDDRPVVPGTIGRGYGWAMKEVFSEDINYLPAENPPLYTGKTEDGQSWYRGFPLPVTHELLEQGKQKYSILCTNCHGAFGDGNGITKQYGMIATATYHSPRLREMPEGEIFNTITHGKGQMLSYADKLTPQERWAVIAYVRALQKSQDATIKDVPQQYHSELGL